MDKKKFITILTAGFALFAMFFGAGNLVIPPYIGLKIGALSGVAFAGFFVSDILLSFLAVVMVASIGLTFTDLGKRFPPLFVNALVFLIIVTLGPLICVPRTGSTTYEVAVQPFFPQIGKIIFGVLYFGITLLLSISKAKIVDIIGKILTPFLILSLTILIVVGTLNAPKELVDNGYSFGEAFAFGFSKGYLTLDVLAGVIFSGLIISSIVQEGYRNEADKKQVTILSGVVAAGCLVFIYGGLLYLGATSSLPSSEGISYIDILKHIAYNVLGDYGGIVISVAVAFACLTSAIAIVSAMGEIFENISKGYAFGENDRHTIFVDACERGSHSGIPAYAPVVLLKQNLRKLNAQSRTRVSRCYAASRTRQAVLVYGRNFAVSIILFIFKTRHP